MIAQDQPKPHGMTTVFKDYGLILAKIEGRGVEGWEEGYILPVPSAPLISPVPPERSTSSKMSFQMSEHNMDPVTRSRESSPLLLYRGAPIGKTDKTPVLPKFGGFRSKTF